MTVVNSKSFTLNSRALTWSRSLVQANFLNLFKCSKIIWGPNFYKKKNFLFWPVQNFFFKIFLCPGHSADSEESIGTYKGHILTLYRPYKKAIKIYPIKTLYGVFFGTFWQFLATFAFLTESLAFCGMSYIAQNVEHSQSILFAQNVKPDHNFLS